MIHSPTSSFVYNDVLARPLLNDLVARVLYIQFQ
jgi:hypothetical protein